MKKRMLYIIVLFVFVSLVGCVETKPLEKVGLATLLGYDLAGENNLSTTSVIRQVNPEFQSNVEVISAENETIKGARAKINRKTSKKIMTGQLRVALYGEELAQEGISHYIDTLLKSPEISGSLLMAVVEGQTKSLLEYQYPTIDDIGQHVFKLLEQNIDSEQTISPTLHEVSNDYYSPGRDIVLPILKSDKVSIEISGVALFKKDKMVGELSAQDSFYVKLIRDSYDSGTFETNISNETLPASSNHHEKIPVVLDTIKTKKDLKLIDSKIPEFDLDLKIEARLVEIKADTDLDKPTNIKKIENAISKSLSAELSRIIAYCQEVDSDVFGFGEQYRSSVRKSNLTHEKWHSMYKDAKINIHIDFTLLRSGIFE